MRSRYAAYVAGDIDYLMETRDPSTATAEERASIAKWSRQAQWLGLEVIATELGGVQDDTGTVEFVARFVFDGVAQVQHERSRFRRIRGRWHYVGGDMVKPSTVVRAGPKVGRNESCPCGSGRKHKKCCGR